MIFKKWFPLFFGLQYLLRFFWPIKLHCTLCTNHWKTMKDQGIDNALVPYVIFESLTSIPLRARYKQCYFHCEYHCGSIVREIRLCSSMAVLRNGSPANQTECSRHRCVNYNRTQPECSCISHEWRRQFPIMLSRNLGSAVTFSRTFRTTLAPSTKVQSSPSDLAPFDAALTKSSTRNSRN